MTDEFDEDFDWTPAYAYKTLCKELLIRSGIMTVIFLVIYLSLELLAAHWGIRGFGFIFIMAVGALQGWLNASILIKGIINKTGLGRLPLLIAVLFTLVILLIVWLLLARMLLFAGGVGIGFFASWRFVFVHHSYC